MTCHFLFGELFEMFQRFKNRELLSDIGPIFECTGHAIGRNLFKTFGEEYKKLTKEHQRESLVKWREENPKKQVELGRKTGQKTIKKRVQAAQKAQASEYEKLFKKALEDENILFEWQAIINVPKGSFKKFVVIDFLIDDIIVEIDGWKHLYNILSDKERDKICRKLGYTILRFTHEEIKINLKRCIESVKTLI